MPKCSPFFVWAILGIVLGTSWFLLNLNLPPQLRGLTCCDANDYVHSADSLRIESRITGDPLPVGKETSSAIALPARLWLIPFTVATYRPIGYPAFLAMHKYGLRTLGVTDTRMWVNFSAVSALALHFFAAVILFMAIRRLGFALHPAALMLFLLHPGLTSHAALPIADSLSVSLMLLGAGVCGLSLATGRRSFAAAAGFFLAAGVWTRPSYNLAIVALLAGWLLLSMTNRKTAPSQNIAMLSLPLLTALLYVIVLAPRIIACAAQAGYPCVVTPLDARVLTPFLLHVGQKSARVYTQVTPDGAGHIVIASDPFLQSFADHCSIGETSPLADLLRCYAKNIVRMPVYLTKKSIGLFDNYHLNTYATQVTPLPVKMMNRAFGAAAFGGFLLLILSWGNLLLHRRWKNVMLTLLLFPIAYFFISLPLSIESRYGLFLAPPGIAAAIWTIQRSSRRTGWSRTAPLLCLSLCAILFLTQTGAWDALDTTPVLTIADFR